MSAMENFPVKILIADDEKNVRNFICSELSAGGAEVNEAENGPRALELLEKKEYDVLLLDLNMPGLGGIDVLKMMKSLDILTEVIILTANATISTAVEAMKLGAYDYLTKPFRLQDLSPIIEKACEKKKLCSENILLRTQLKRQTEGRQLITKSQLMLDLLATVKQVATTDYPVLITGETGTGKEHIARIMHRESLRAELPFVAINCGALPESMIESELFGYEKGAFTGAHARKPGLLEVAHTGTLFLDEIGDMPAPLQVKLLRVIESGSFFRLGGIREMKVNVRLVSATNKDLQAEIEKGAFRQDLYYRVTMLIVHVPPLRKRREDIPVLIEYFIDSSQAFKHKKFSKEAITVLTDYDWPGNVRELQNVIHRVLLLSTSNVIKPSDLPADLIRGPRLVKSSRRLEDVEREHILRVLTDVRGQKGKAAEALGMDPKTLYRKLCAYGIKE
jgi:DNA-binding NtrC family response regulator